MTATDSDFCPYLGRNMQQCIEKCCNLGKCDIAYSIDRNCFGIECFSENKCHVQNDEVPDTTSTEISIVKNLKIKHSSKYNLTGATLGHGNNN